MLLNLEGAGIDHACLTTGVSAPSARQGFLTLGELVALGSQGGFARTDR